MSERHSVSIENLPEEQVAALHEQAERLFMAGTLRFGGPDVGYPDAGTKNKVRYQTDSELVTIMAPTTQLFARPPEGVPPVYDSSWLRLAIESPLPSTDRWPNSYIKHDFLLPKGSQMREPDETGESEGYLHSMAVVHYSKEGVREDDIEAGIMVGLTGGVDMLPVSDEVAEYVFGQLDGFQNEQVENVRRVYPDYDQLMQPQWAPDYCAERIAMLAGLSAIDEVGCDPNPYIRG